MPLSERVPRIIALRTKNARAAYEDLSARGIEFIRSPRDPDPETGVECVVCCRDPDGLIVEFHPHPAEALSDADQALPLDTLGYFTEEIRRLAAALGRNVV